MHTERGYSFMFITGNNAAIKMKEWLKIADCFWFLGFVSKFVNLNNSIGSNLNKSISIKSIVKPTVDRHLMKTLTKPKVSNSVD